MEEAEAALEQEENKVIIIIVIDMVMKNMIMIMTTELSQLHLC